MAIEVTNQHSKPKNHFSLTDPAEVTGAKQNSLPQYLVS